MTEATKNAIWLAETYGAYVFPCARGTKVPTKGDSWPEISTNDPDMIRKIASHPNYEDCNWALDCGKSGLSVLDLDTKNGKDGRKALAGLPRFSSGLRAETPNNGFHVIMRGKLPTSAGKLGPGLDTRGVGGYILIAGSKLRDNPKPYRWVAQGKPSEVPGWMVEKLGQAAKKDPERSIPVIDERPHHVQAAVRYLQDHAPEAVQGDAGDHTTFTVACRCRDLGCSRETTLELMLEYWNEVKAHPPWSVADLEKKVTNAYKYAADRPGNATPEALFPPPSPGKLLPGMRRASDLRIENLKPRPWVLGKRYLAGNVTLTLSPGGVGKSIFTIVEGMSVATGKQLTFDPVHLHGPALVINAEDPPEELDRRLMAAMRHHGLAYEECDKLITIGAQDEPWHLIAYGSKGELVVNENKVQEIIASIKSVGAVFFSCDPMVGFHAVSENDNTAMELLMHQFRRIARETQAAVGVVHHVTKGSNDRSRGLAEMARGASAITNAARIATTLYPMTPAEARVYGVDPSRMDWYVRMDRAKGNYSAPGEPIHWYEKVSVRLTIEEDPTGTVQPVNLVSVVPDSDETQVRAAIQQQVHPGRPITVYKLAAQFRENDTFPERGHRTLMRQIQDALPRPYEANGLVWRITQLPVGKGEKTALCVDCRPSQEG